MYDNTEAARLNRSFAYSAAAALDVVARSASSAADLLRSSEFSARSASARARAERPRDRLGPCERSLHGYDPQRAWRLK